MFQEDCQHLIEVSRACAKECNISEALWQSLLDDLEPLYDWAPDMYAHSLRVGVYSWNLAVRENLDAKLALHGGCAHDIGKCTVPKEVIYASTFGPAEREAMSVHPMAGFHILKDTHLFSAFIAGLHHEFQDEPYGIDIDDVAPWPLSPEMREAILQMAELVSFADYYDALTTRLGPNGLMRNDEEVGDVLYARFGGGLRTELLMANAGRWRS